MSYALRLDLAARLNATESVDTTTSPASGEGGNQRRYNQYGVEVNLNSASFPAVAGQVADLSCVIPIGGTVDFDLTAIPWAGNVSKTFDATGKKLVAILIRASKANAAGGVTFGPQGVNGYALYGASKLKIIFPGWQGCEFCADPDQLATFTNNVPAVAAGAKDLRFAGTSADIIKCLAAFSA